MLNIRGIIMGKFLIKHDGEKIKFELAAANREIIASSDLYGTKSACMKGIASVIKNAPDAPVEDRTVKDFEKLINPKFEIYKDDGGRFRFDLKAKNGQTVIFSEAYKAKASCKNGIESVRRNSVDAEIVEL